MSEKTCDLDYRAEYKRLKEEIFRIQEKKKDYECKITDLQLTIAELRGNTEKMMASRDDDEPQV